MDPQQIYEESMKMARESHVNMLHIKWALICIAVNLWGISLYLLLKEAPKWWKSFDKKNTKPNTLEQRNKDLAAATQPRKTPWDWNRPE